MVVFFLILFSFLGSILSGPCTFDNDHTTEASCGDAGPCTNYFRRCRCVNSKSSYDLIPSETALGVSVNWDEKHSLPIFLFDLASKRHSPFTPPLSLASQSQSSFCLSLSFEQPSRQLQIQLQLFEDNVCSSTSLSTITGILPSNEYLEDLFIKVSGGSSEESKYLNFLESSRNQSECLLGDLFVPPKSSERIYKVGGPFDCGFHFKNIRVKFSPHSTFSIFIRSKSPLKVCENPTLCPHQMNQFDDQTLGPRRNLLEPRVTCLQPCIGDTCFVELGYINRFSSSLKVDGDMSFTDMGYKYIPPYSKEHGVVNIMYPKSCQELQARRKFHDSNGRFVLFDPTPYFPCNVTNEKEKCSLHNYVVNFNEDPHSVWTDEHSFNELMNFWREQFGWNHTNSKRINNKKGYIGFRGQPISFAPGKHDSVSIIPIKKDDHFCWVLGGSFLDICTSHSCRAKYDSLGCSRTTGLHFVYSYFYTHLRLNQKSGFDNFKRMQHHSEDFQIDNAYRATFVYQFQPVKGGKESSLITLDRLSSATFPLPSPCMVDGPSTLFYLESYESDCGARIKPPCPGGYCAPIISRLHDPPLRAPFQTPGSGCSLGACLPEGVSPLPDSCNCTNGSWEQVGTCRKLSCLSFADNEKPYSQNFTWAQCAAPSIEGVDPIKERGAFKSMEHIPSCGCSGITECPQMVLEGGKSVSSLQSSTACQGNTFSPHCTPPDSFSGNKQKSLWKMELCDGTDVECGPSFEVDGMKGCTPEWTQHKCHFYSFTFNYVCSGVGNERSTCKYINVKNHQNLVANDIRDILQPGVDFISWQRGKGNQQLTNKFDPDADGILGWTTSYYCLETNQQINVPECTLEYGCSPDPKSHPPHLFSWGNSSSPPSCGCCGNGICEPSLGEDCYECPFDCKSGRNEGEGDDSFFCCGKRHTFESQADECANPICRVNNENVTCDNSVTCSGGDEQRCYHCIGHRIPLEIALSDGSSNMDQELLSGCEYFPLTQATCGFEKSSPCDSCGPGPNSGCSSDQFCNKDKCICEPKCKGVDCAMYNADCDVGQRAITSGFDCDTGASTCCEWCPIVYSKDLQKTTTTVCSQEPCCPKFYRPHEPDHCSCVPCEVVPDSCVCGRCDPGALFQTSSPENNHLSVIIERWNPFACECVRCDPDDVCPDDQLLFPPPLIKNSPNTTRLILEWLQSNSLDMSLPSSHFCPSCISCSDLVDHGLLLSPTGDICKYPSIVDPCECADCDYQCPGLPQFPAKASRGSLEIFQKNREGYLKCFSIDPVCNHTKGLVRNWGAIDQCECAKCMCPDGFVFPPSQLFSQTPCDYSKCQPCVGAILGGCETGKKCFTFEGKPASYGDCNDPCDLCFCEECNPMETYSCTKPQDGSLPDQFDWYILGDACDSRTCQRCLDINNCPARGMAFDVSNMTSCECVPCSSDWDLQECDCVLIMDEDGFGLDFEGINPDVAFWAEKSYHPSTKMSDFLGMDRDFCVGDTLYDCLANNAGLDTCVDFSSGGNFLEEKKHIRQPDGSRCVGTPYGGFWQFTPYFMWNRMAGGNGTCGPDVHIRVPTSAGNQDPGLFQVIPSRDVDEFLFVNYSHRATHICSLPLFLPDNFFLTQGKPFSRTRSRMSEGQRVDWRRVSFSEWIQSLFLGMIDDSCLKGVRRVQPFTNLEIFDFKGQTCTALVYHKDVKTKQDEEGGWMADLSGKKLGAFKFEVLDFEIPPGFASDSSTCPHNLSSGIACDALQTRRVDFNVDGMYLMMWVSIPCEDGTNGYIWENEVARFGLGCGPMSCGEQILEYELDVNLTAHGSFCVNERGKMYLTVSVDWGGLGKRCDPHLKVWVDGGDQGNDLRVPLSVDGVDMDCSYICIDHKTQSDQVCSKTFEVKSNLIDRRIMASSCGGGSDGGGGKPTIKHMGVCNFTRASPPFVEVGSEESHFLSVFGSENLKMFGGSTSNNFVQRNQGDKTFLKYAIACDSVDYLNGATYFLNSGENSCRCEKCRHLDSCPDRCGTKLSDDRCSCVACDDFVEVCQTGWAREQCSEGRWWLDADEETIRQNDCSHCFKCPKCNPLKKPGTCEWSIVGPNCTYNDRSLTMRCPEGQRILVQDDTVVLDDDNCPVCGVECPCEPALDHSDPDYLIVYVLENICDSSCVPRKIPRNIVNHSLCHAKQDPACNGQVMVEYCPCEKCPRNYTLSDPTNNCTCVPCNVTCERGWKYAPGDNCTCIPCACSDCYNQILQTRPSLCSDDGTCSGCTNQNGTAFAHRCDRYFHCDPTDLCSLNLLECSNCTARYGPPPPEDGVYYSWIEIPAFAWQYEALGGTCTPENNQIGDYCSVESGFCAKTECKAPICDMCEYRTPINTCEECEKCLPVTCNSGQKYATEDGKFCHCKGCIDCQCGVDCFPSFDQKTWYACDDQTPCDLPKPCSLFPGQVFCDGVVVLGGIQNRVLPKKPESIKNQCDFQDVCGCEYAPCTCGPERGDCVPHWSKGIPYSCDPREYCDGVPKRCPACTNFKKERYKTKLEVVDPCNNRELCGCVSCKCGRDCSSYFNNNEEIWYACEPQALCEGPKSCSAFPGQTLCEGVIDLNGNKFKLRPKKNEEITDRCDYHDICECVKVPCNCGFDPSQDCVPGFDQLGVPQYCESQKYCARHPTPCSPCPDPSKRWKRPDEVRDVCDTDDLCGCVSCECGKDCAPYFHSEKNTWFACDSSALCEEPKPCTDYPGQVVCQGTTVVNGIFYEIFPKKRNQISNLCDYHEVCECVYSPLECPHCENGLVMKLNSFFGFSSIPTRERACGCVPCQYGDDCKISYSQPPGLWFVCDEEALCASPKPCTMFPDQKSCQGLVRIDGTQLRLRPKGLDEIKNERDYHDICECVSSPCTCGNNPEENTCVPQIDTFDGVPLFCDPDGLCEGPKRCPPCNPHLERRKSASEVKDFCDPQDVCECVPCQCLVESTPFFDLEEGRWYRTVFNSPCEPPIPCPTKCKGAQVRDGIQYHLVPKVPGTVPKEVLCDPFEICECDKIPCTCGNNEAHFDCTPGFFDGVPYYCDPSEYCDGVLRSCPQNCDNSTTHRWKTKSEVSNICDVSDICQCAECKCGVECIPYFDSEQSNWFYCHQDNLCNEPRPCPTCQKWAKRHNITLDPTKEKWKERISSFPPKDVLCVDPCECQKEPCEQICSVRLGEKNNEKTCGPCSVCPETCPQGTHFPVVEFDAIPFVEDVQTKCSQYWSYLEFSGEHFFPEEEEWVDLSTICEVNYGRCTCILSKCDCVPCESCTVCPENQIGRGCNRRSYPPHLFDSSMYYREPGNCESACALCPPCTTNETHTLHRKVAWCDENECFNRDGTRNNCRNTLQSCNDPCNCDITTPCSPVFHSEDAIEIHQRFCDGRFERFETSGSQLGDVHCSECVPCECDDSVCEYNQYVDPEAVCGVTKTPFLCGKKVLETNLPCACPGQDDCRSCVDCPIARKDTWISGQFFPTICPHGKMLDWDGSKWKLPEHCSTHRCTDPTKVNDMCQCNCIECTEEYFLRGICKEAGTSAPAACRGPPASLTCNSFFQEDFNRSYLYSFNSTSCSCQVCGFADLSHLDCDPFSPNFALSKDGCTCIKCDDPEDMCCPPSFDPNVCDPSRGYRPSSTYCGCELCPSNCDLCHEPDTACALTPEPKKRVRLCKEKRPCLNSQPALVSCRGRSDLLDDCTLESDFIRNTGCYEECEPCTGVMCTHNNRGERIFGKRPNRFSPCLCETCGSYGCSRALTSVMLEHVRLPPTLESQNRSFFLSHSDDFGIEQYWDMRCQERCIECSDDLCVKIGKHLSLPLKASKHNPCNCVACPFEPLCPMCPWCDPSGLTKDCRCVSTTNEDGATAIVCQPPSHCEGRAPGTCDLSQRLRKKKKAMVAPRSDDGLNCMWNMKPISLYSGFVTENCTCNYFSSPEDCPPPENTCQYTNQECDPAFPCECRCRDSCYHSYCPPRSCQPDQCSIECVGCPKCPKGSYIRKKDRFLEGDDNGEWLCGGDQCQCTPCTEECHLPSQYLDEENCVCVDCMITCQEDEIFVYPNATHPFCSCLACDKEALDCDLTCDRCRHLVTQNNKCECQWCLPEVFWDTLYDSYGPEDCPVESSPDDCLCGRKESEQIKDWHVEEDGGCPFEYECGCCPDLRELCLREGGSRKFCEEIVCETQRDCAGECTGHPLQFDSCGVACGSEECQVIEPSSSSDPSEKRCLGIDICRVCGGNGEFCVGCDGVLGSGFEWGVDCQTGEIVCNGTDPSHCPFQGDGWLLDQFFNGEIFGIFLAGASLVFIAFLFVLLFWWLFETGESVELDPLSSDFGKVSAKIS